MLSEDDNYRMTVEDGVRMKREVPDESRKEAQSGDARVPTDELDLLVDELGFNQRIAAQKVVSRQLVSTTLLVTELVEVMSMSGVISLSLSECVENGLYWRVDKANPISYRDVDPRNASYHPGRVQTRSTSSTSGDYARSWSINKGAGAGAGAGARSGAMQTDEDAVETYPFYDFKFITDCVENYCTGEPKLETS